MLIGQLHQPLSQYHPRPLLQKYFALRPLLFLAVSGLRKTGFDLRRHFLPGLISAPVYSLPSDATTDRHVQQI